MDRKIRRSKPLVLATALTALAVCGGCAAPLATFMYLIGGADTPAAFDGLKDKRVVVVCRPSSASQYSSKRPALEVSRDVSSLLAAHVFKIDVVPQRKVQDWMDENEWDEYTEVGEAFDADMVVAIDLDKFSLYEGQTLYRGNAEYILRVFDMEQDGKTVHEHMPEPALYPPNTGIYTQDRTESEFRRQFVRVVAERIARQFYSHDHRIDFAMDSATLTR